MAHRLRGNTLPGCCLLALLACGAVAADPTNKDNSPELVDGLRRLVAKEYGVSVLHPPAWELTSLQRGDRAFVLTLPKDHAADPKGIVACEIGIAPASLAEYQKRIAAQARSDAEKEESDRKLLSNRLVEPRAKGPKVQVLESIWTYDRPKSGVWYDVKRYVMQNQHLYTFTLQIDQGHYEAYHLDFVKMADSAKFTPVETGLQQLPGGYWMQRDFGFGMILPEAWQPGFGAADNILFFATGATKEVFAENLIVMASKAEQLDLAKLKEDLPGKIRKLDPNSKILRSDVITVGKRQMLETVIQSQRGPFNFTIVERRFQGIRLNYEVRFTILTDNFEKLEKNLRDSADSFREFPLPGKTDVI